MPLKSKPLRKTKNNRKSSSNNKFIRKITEIEKLNYYTLETKQNSNLILKTWALH